MDFLDLKHLDGSTRSNRSIQGNKSERRSRLWMRLLQYSARVPKHLAIHIVHSQARQRFNDLHGIGKTRDSLPAFPGGDGSLAHFRYRCKLLLRQTEVTANCMNVVANIVKSDLPRVLTVLGGSEGTAILPKKGKPRMKKRERFFPDSFPSRFCLIQAFAAILRA